MGTETKEYSEFIKWFHDLGKSDQYALINKLIFFGDESLIDAVILGCETKLLAWVKEGYEKRLIDKG